MRCEFFTTERLLKKTLPTPYNDDSLKRKAMVGYVLLGMIGLSTLDFILQYVDGSESLPPNHRRLPCDTSCAQQGDTKFTRNEGIILGYIILSMVGLSTLCCIAKCYFEARANQQNHIQEPRVDVQITTNPLRESLITPVLAHSIDFGNGDDSSQASIELHAVVGSDFISLNV